MNRDKWYAYSCYNNKHISQVSMELLLVLSSRSHSGIRRLHRQRRKLTRALYAKNGINHKRKIQQSAQPRNQTLFTQCARILTNLFSNLCQISTRQHVQIRGQRAGLDHSMVLGIVKWLPKGDVIPESGILDPSLLGDVGNGSLK